MPMQILMRLCQTRLPIAIYGEEDVGKCRVLLAAGLIEARVTRPGALWGRPTFSAQATIFRVTPKGRSASGSLALAPGFPEFPSTDWTARP